MMRTTFRRGLPWLDGKQSPHPHVPGSFSPSSDEYPVPPTSVPIDLNSIASKSDWHRTTLPSSNASTTSQSESVGAQSSSNDERSSDPFDDGTCGNRELDTRNKHKPGYYTPSSSSSLSITPDDMVNKETETSLKIPIKPYVSEVRLSKERNVRQPNLGDEISKIPAVIGTSGSETTDLPTCARLRAGSSSSTDLGGLEKNRKRTDVVHEKSENLHNIIDLPYDAANYQPGVITSSADMPNHRSKPVQITTLSEGNSQRRHYLDLEDIPLSSSSSRSPSPFEQIHLQLGQHHPNLPIYPSKTFTGLRHTLNKRATHIVTSSETPDESWSQPAHSQVPQQVNDKSPETQRPTKLGQSRYWEELENAWRGSSSVELQEQTKLGIYADDQRRHGRGYRSYNRHANRPSRPYKRKPIGRNWNTARKRLAAAVACFSTAIIGVMIGIYAGEVPRIQYQLADQNHSIILGNMALYLGLAVSTFFFWPLPLLHGRKPYTLAAFALVLPLQFPQALTTSAPRDPYNAIFRVGLLLPRGFSGFFLGFANVNLVATLFDLFGVSLQSSNPHQEVVIPTDIRRHGGGMGLWIGIWTWCFVGSIAIGFLIGANIIADLNPAWGFYIMMILVALALFLNIIVPETRRAPSRRSVLTGDAKGAEYSAGPVRGEVKLHISKDAPRWWWEEVLAGIFLSLKMMKQPGFFVLSFYIAWIYAQVVLVVLLLGALLSREYRWFPGQVGAGVLSIALGGLVAIPLTKAGIFSRARTQSARTDSMTVKARVAWTSHLVRRIIFTSSLPVIGIGYTFSSAGGHIPWIVPILFAAAVGFLSVLAIAECYGLLMETFDTCDLQPGVNSRHRLQSLADEIRRRRTNYSSFPRVTAGIFVSQTLSFGLAAAATIVGSVLTRRIGAQAAIGCTAGILFLVTILLTLVLLRWNSVQVIPEAAWRRASQWEANYRDRVGPDWRPVVIGNPSGMVRKMNLLEMGEMSRWSEIRKLNQLTD